MTNIHYLFTIFVLLGTLDNILAEAPAKVGAPTTSEISETSFNVSYVAVDDANRYCVTTTSRHGSTDPKITCTTEVNLKVSNLQGSTLYDVTVQAESDTGEMGEISDATSAQTLPEAPTIQLSRSLPTSMFVLMKTPNYARVTQWTVQYRETGTSTIDNVTTPDGEYYAVWLSKLKPNTSYDIRAYASKVAGLTVRQDISSVSDWITATTDSLSVFGRVVMNDILYDASVHSDLLSKQSEDILNKLQIAYENKTNVHSIELIEIEAYEVDSTDFARVHYTMKVTDQTYPDDTTLVLNGSDFLESLINSGDNQAAFPVISKMNSHLQLELHHPELAPRSPCKGFQSRSITVTDEDNGTYPDIVLLDKSYATSDISQTVTIDDTRILENVTTLQNIESNTVHGFDFEYRLKTCAESRTELLYSETHVASESKNPTSIQNITSFLFTTGITPADIDTDGVTYSTSVDETSITLNIPAVDKAIMYEILNESNNIIASLIESEIDGSNSLKLQVNDLELQKDYWFWIRVTTRKHDGTLSIATSDGGEYMA